MEHKSPLPPRIPLPTIAGASANGFSTSFAGRSRGESTSALVRTMAIAPNSGAAIKASDIESQMAKLNKVSSDRKSAKRLARNKDAIQALMKSLNEHPRFSKMVEYSLKCLSNLAVNEVSVEEMIEEGVLDTLTKVLKLNPYNEAVHRMVNETMSTFAVSDHIAKMIMDRVGGSDILFSLKKHVEPETVGAAATVMAKLMRVDSTVSTFVQNGAVDTLAYVAANMKDQPEVMASVADCIRSVARVPSHVDLVMQSPILAQVLGSLQSFPYNAHLVTSSLSLFSNLATSSAANATVIAKMGAVDVLVGALEANPENASILKLGATALKALSTSAEIAVAMRVKLGATDEVANAVAKLASMMLVEENVQVMIESNGVSWLLDAIKVASKEPTSEASLRIIRSGCRAVMRLATDEKKIYSIMSAGGVGVLMSLVGSHGRDEQVISAALRAVGSIVTRKVNADYVLKLDVLTALKTSLEAHDYSAKVVPAAAIVYERLSKHAEVHAAIVAGGGAAQLVEGLKRHIKDGDVVQSVLSALKELASSSSGAAALVEAGAFAIISQVLLEHKDNEAVVNAALATLSAIVNSYSTLDEAAKKSLLASSNAVKLEDIILQVMNNLPEALSVQAAGSQVVQALAGADKLKISTEAVAVAAKKMTSGPVSSAVLAAPELDKAVRQLVSLLLVDTNITPLVSLGAPQVLVEAVKAAALLSDSASKSELLEKVSEGMKKFAEVSPEAARIFANPLTMGALVNASLRDPAHEMLGELVMGLVAQCLPVADKEVLAALVKSGVVANVVQVAKAMHLNETVQSSASRCLAFLCADAAVASTVVSGGGVGVVIAALQTNMDMTTDVAKSLEVMRKVITTEEASTSFANEGGLNVIITILKRHSHDAPVVQGCLRALVSILRTEEIASAMGERGVIQLVVPAVREHYKVYLVIEAAVVLLETLAAVKANRVILLQGGFNIVSLMQWVCTKYKDKKIVVESAFRLIKLLSEEEEAQEAERKRIEEEKARELKSQEIIVAFDDATVDEILMELGQATGTELQALLVKLTKSKVRPEDIKTITNKGLLRAIADIVTGSDDPELHVQAVASFLAMCSEGFEGDLLESLEDPAIVGAHCDVFLPRGGLAAAPNADIAKALTSLAKLKMRQGVVDEIMRKEALPALVGMMTTSDDVDIRNQAAKLLGRMSNNDDAAAALASLTSIRELIDAIRKHISNAEFTRYGIYLLGNLAITPELKDQIGIDSGIQLIVQAINAHRSNSQVVQICLYSLSALTHDAPNNCAFLVASKGIPLILALISENLKVSDLLDSAMCILVYLSQSNDAYKTQIVTAGGAQSVVDCILNNYDDVEVQTAAVRTLGELVYNAQTVDLVVKAGGVQGIVAGVTVMSDQPELLSAAIQVMSRLITFATDEHLMVMAQEGAVRAILDVFAANANDLALELECVRALCNLAVQHDSADVIIRQNGTEIVVGVLQTLGYDAEFAETALRLLYNLTFSINNLNRLLSAGVAEVVMSAMKTHATSFGAVTTGLKCISNLCYSEETSISVAETGIIEYTMGILTASFASSAVIIECLDALSALSRAEVNAISMVDSIMPLCSRALTLYVADAPLVATVARFLHNIFFHASVSLAAVKTDIIASLASALLTQRLNVELMLTAVRPFENMAFGGQDVRDYLKEKGIVEVMQQIIAASPDRGDLKGVCDLVISAINRKEIEMTNLDFIEVNRERRDIKDVYAALGEEKEEELGAISEVPPKIRNLLTAGALLTKHSMTAPPRTRHVFVTDDLKWLVWKDPKSKSIEEETRMKIFKIRTVEKGRCTEQLKRQRFGKYLADDKCAFSVQGRERSVDLECSSEKERDKWVHAIGMLIAYRKSIQALQNKTSTFV